MHYNVDYNAIADEAERKEKAVKDFEEWIGTEKRLSVIRDYAKDESCNFNDFAMACSFAGIQGYPVAAAYEKYSGKKAEWAKED